KEAETKYKTLGNQMKIFMNNVRDLGISIGGALAPMITFIMKGLTAMIQWLSKAPAPIRAVVGVLTVLVAAIGPVLVALGAMAASIGAIIANWTIISGVLSAIGGVFAAVSAPIWITIGAIVALGTAFVVAYKKSETFRNIVQGAIRGIVTAFQFLWSSIKSIGSAIGNFIMKNIIGPIASFGTKIMAQIMAFWNQNGPMIMQALQNIWNVASPILTALFNLFKTVFQGILGVVVSVLSGLWMVVSP